MPKKDTLEKLLLSNREWAKKMKIEEPRFFDKLSHLQTPKFMWIGCADSRVPATQITGLLPGEMFVHRNVANVVVHTDLNCLSVLQYAVDILQVDHIIVCGHYECGGIKAVIDGKKSGLIDNWLKHVADVQQKHSKALKNIKDKAKRFKMLCKFNVMEQADNVCQTTVVQDAWKRKQRLSVHAVIYDIHDGLLHRLWTKNSNKH